MMLSVSALPGRNRLLMALRHVSSHLIDLEMVKSLQQKLNRVTPVHAASTRTGGDSP